MGRPGRQSAFELFGLAGHCSGSNGPGLLANVPLKTWNKPIGKDQAEVLPLAATIVNLSDGRQQSCGAAIGTGEAERDTASLWGRPAFRLPTRVNAGGAGFFRFRPNPVS